MRTKRAPWLLALLLAACAAGGYYFFAPARTPAGQPALVNLDRAGFESFEQAFDDSANRVRVIALLSPTGSTCLRGASAVQGVLQEFGSAPLSVFIVWEPILVTDAAGVTRPALARITDRRVAQFWDKGHQLSKHMGGPAAFGPTSGAKIRFDMEEHVWDFVAVYAPGFRWQDSGASPSFAAAPVVEVVGDLRAQIATALADNTTKQ